VAIESKTFSVNIQSRMFFHKREHVRYLRRRRLKVPAVAKF
jgi:hypothetical protein